MTLDPPELLTVPERLCLAATVTLPKLRLAGADASAPAATPEPDKAIVNVGFDPSEVIVMLPLALPEDCGAKVTLNTVL